MQRASDDGEEEDCERFRPPPPDERPVPPPDSNDIWSTMFQAFGQSVCLSLLLFSTCVTVFMAFYKRHMSRSDFLAKYAYLFPKDRPPVSITQVRFPSCIKYPTHH